MSSAPPPPPTGLVVPLHTLKIVVEGKTVPVSLRNDPETGQTTIEIPSGARTGASAQKRGPLLTSTQKKALFKCCQITTELGLFLMLFVGVAFAIATMTMGFTPLQYERFPLTSLQWYGEKSCDAKPICQIFVGSNSGRGKSSDVLFVAGMCPFQSDGALYGYGLGFGTGSPNDSPIYNNLYRMSANNTVISVENTYARRPTSTVSSKFCDSRLYTWSSVDEDDGEGTWYGRMMLSTSDNNRLVVRSCGKGVLAWDANPRDFRGYTPLVVTASIATILLGLIVACWVAFVVSGCLDGWDGWYYIKDTFRVFTLYPGGIVGTLTFIPFVIMLVQLR
jgi:hypothetical protein